MNVRDERRGRSDLRNWRRATVGVEALEGRALLASAGLISDIATLPSTITSGPMAIDSSSVVWFAEEGRAGGPALGKLSATGVVSEVPLPASDAANTIAAVAADASGNVWYALSGPAGKVGKVASKGDIREFPLASSDEQAGAVAVGADGALYVAVTGGTNGPAIDRVTGTGATTETPVKGTAGPLTWLAKGSDGNIWFVDGAKIGRVTQSGGVTEFSLPAQAGGVATDLSNAQLTAGSDGNVWFLGLGGISKITPAGAVTTISVPNAQVTGLSSASDKSLYIAVIPPAGSQLAQTPGEVVARLTTSGRITPFNERVDAGQKVTGMTGSPDGSVWLSLAGKTFTRVDVAALPTIDSVMITPTTPHAVKTNALGVIASAIVSFTANYSGARASDFSATINYGDGYTGKGAVVNDSNGGYDVIGYDRYKLPAGRNVKVKVDVTGPNGVTNEIFGVVTIEGPAAKGKPVHLAKAPNTKPPMTTHQVKKK